MQVAAELIRDSYVLYKRRSYPRAFSLLVLGHEEIGKAVLLAKAYKNKSNIKYCSPEWRELYSHQAKQTAWAKYINMFYPNATPPSQTQLKLIVKMYEPLKEGGFYSEWVRKSRHIKGKRVLLRTGKWQIASQSGGFFKHVYEMKASTISNQWHLIKYLLDKQLRMKLTTESAPRKSQRIWFGYPP